MKKEERDETQEQQEVECPCCRWMEEELGVIDAAPYSMLIERGVELPDPSTVSDEELHEVLWRLIEGLASIRIFIESTDHMSDRELYEILWRETVHQTVWFSPDDPWSACHVDFSGSCGEDLDRFLRYYADDEFRDEWRSDFPEYVVPPREEPPYRRDELLPVPTYPDRSEVPS